MINSRTFLLLVFLCWVISVPVMFYNLEEYHPTHGRNNPVNPRSYGDDADDVIERASDERSDEGDPDIARQTDGMKSSGMESSDRQSSIMASSNAQSVNGESSAIKSSNRESSNRELSNKELSNRESLNGESSYKEPSEVWPRFNESQDRILAQMALDRRHGTDLKVILLHGFFAGEHLPLGREKFIGDSCPLDQCHITRTHSDAGNADLIITKGTGISNLLKKYPNRPDDQIIVWYQLESPLNSWSSGVVNWTATYRRDSTLNTPYFKFSPYENSVLERPSARNYAKGKSKQVAWFVSNCQADNGRMEYAKELAKYIDVDIYGKCGTLSCSRKYHQDKCVQLLNSDYKFYLAFENSNCRDYITEKFFGNGLS